MEFSLNMVHMLYVEVFLSWAWHRSLLCAVALRSQQQSWVEVGVLTDRHDIFSPGCVCRGLRFCCWCFKTFFGLSRNSLSSEIMFSQNIATHEDWSCTKHRKHFGHFDCDFFWHLIHRCWMNFAGWLVLFSVYMVPVCGPVPPRPDQAGYPPATPPRWWSPLPASPAPCNVPSSVCASTREDFFNVAPSPSACASVQVQEKIL